MSLVNSSFSRDNNGIPITTLGIINSKSVTYVAGTTGAVGALTLFTVTGTVCMNVFGICTADLTSGGAATVEIGTATATASLANQVTATNITAHKVYHDAVLAVGGTNSNTHVVNEDVIQTIRTTTVTGGSIVFYCNWVPLTSDGNVVAA